MRPRGLWPARLPSPLDFPGKNTGVGGHFLLQGIFPTQGSNPCLLHWKANSLPLCHVESPLISYLSANSASRQIHTNPTADTDLHTHTHTSLNHQQKCPGSNQIMISHLVLSSWPQRLCFQMQTFRLPKSFASKPGSLTKTREISQRFHPPAFSVAETVDRRQPSLSWCAIIPFFYFTVQNKQRQS